MAIVTSCRELFPTKFTLAIFILYMSLFVGQGIFVTASQESNNTYGYNTVTVVLLTEALKLVISIAFYSKEQKITSLLGDIRKDVVVMMLYFVPAFLYCLYNNLIFVNLSTFDPTSYYLLLQFRVVVTGILFQIIFKKHLTTKQWLSLILLTIGCMIKQLNLNSLFQMANSEPGQSSSISKNFYNASTSEKNTIIAPKMEIKTEASVDIITVKPIGYVDSTATMDFGISVLLILAQIMFSCLAGVYNEYLLKDRGSDVNIFVQNVFMYLDSIICNMVVLTAKGELTSAFHTDSLKAIFRLKVLVIIVNNAAIGIVTSFFLKYMNSILKTFASALELIFTAIFCYFLFAIPIYINTALAIAVVSFAIYLYSQSPVVNTASRQNGANEHRENVTV